MGCDLMRVQEESGGWRRSCNQNILLSDAKEAANSSEAIPPRYSILIDLKHEREEEIEEQNADGRCQAQTHI